MHELATTRAHAPSKPTLLHIGQFTFDAKAGELREGPCKTVLQSQPLQVLLMLLERPGEVVSRHEIQRRLWPEGVVVNFEVGISQAVRKLRSALHDSASEPRYVETVGRRGYRLKVPVMADRFTGAEADHGEPVLDFTSAHRSSAFRVVGMDERKVLAEVLRQLLEMLAYVGRSLQQVPITDADLNSPQTITKLSRRALPIPGSLYRAG
jgi:DNA-binding winged helix-turn-helix (wHTH) protein